MTTTKTTRPSAKLAFPSRRVPPECLRYVVLAQNSVTGQYDIVAMATRIEIATSAARALIENPSVSSTWGDGAQIWEHWFRPAQAKCIGHVTAHQDWMCA